MVFFVILLLPLFSAATIDTKLEYSKGETIIAKISGNFIDPIELTNVFFYRNVHVITSVDYEIGKLGDNYYLKASLVGKDPGNYSVVIKGVHYYIGGQVSEAEITRNFTITSGQASFSVDPGFIISEGDFSIDLTNLLDLEISISIDSPDKIDAVTSVKISPQQIKTVFFSISNITEDLSSIISLSGSSTDYEIPIYLFGENLAPVCGNNVLDKGELCDGNNWGDIEDCSDFGFSSGALSCNAPGNYDECRFDTSDCFNSSSDESICGNEIIEAGEQCDEDSWGTIKSCTQFGFDAGKLSCVDCSFDASDCYDYQECDEDRDCDTDEECISHECIRKDIECEENNDCKYSEECRRGECVQRKKECVNDNYCSTGYTCDNGFCVPKDKECEEASECDDNQICKDWKCVDVDSSFECIFDSDCTNSGEKCQHNICVDEIAEQTCSDLNGRFCESGETCEGSSQDVRGKDCCMGACLEQQSSTGKIIGWSLIILIVLGLIFFYIKYKKTNKKVPDLVKIGSAPKVKGNLFR